MKKSVIEWFLYLPPDIAKRAIENKTKHSTEEVETETLASAISGSFGWFGSPEGGDYWESMFRGALDSSCEIRPHHLQSSDPTAYMIGFNANETFKNENSD